MNMSLVSTFCVENRLTQRFDSIVEKSSFIVSSSDFIHLSFVFRIFYVCILNVRRFIKCALITQIIRQRYVAPKHSN